MRVLAITRTKEELDLVKISARRHDDDFEGTTDADDGIDLVMTYEYDAVLILGSGSGCLALVRRLRADKSRRVGILVLADGPGSVVECLSAGADDFLVMPWHSDELLARVRAVSRRYHGRCLDVIGIGALRLDVSAKMLFVDGGLPVYLRASEYKIFEFLASRMGRTVHKDVVLEFLYGGRDAPDVKIVDVLVCHLRKKLRMATGGDQVIETVWGRGYTIREAA